MHALVRPFFQMCLMRLGPQDLPPSQFLLGLTLAAYTLCGFVASTVYMSAGQALLATLVDALLLCLLTAGLLVALRLQRRVVQTLTALTGTGVLLTVLAYPFVVWVEAVRANDGQQGFETVVLAGLIAWTVAVIAHIMRHALSTGFGLGVAVAIVYSIISLQAQHALQQLAA